MGLATMRWCKGSRRGSGGGGPWRRRGVRAGGARRPCPPSASAHCSSFPSPSRQVESSDTPKDIAAVPKCPPPCPEASPAEPLPNGDVEGDSAQWKGAEEGGASPKGGRPEEDETESLPDGETGRALENGRCTPKEGLDAPADEGELAPSDPQKKRGRRKLLEAAEKSKTLALRAPGCGSARRAAGRPLRPSGDPRLPPPCPACRPRESCGCSGSRVGERCRRRRRRKG